ncbi:protein Spindly-like [Paralichthys olivaceus]|uniref:protein Spindly-like n=1 Tax=Paralichthys olivaceus TaxID=8255 RepID=UPI003753405C
MAQFLKPSTEETAAFICEENKSHLHRQQFPKPSSFAKMDTVACGTMQVQKEIDDLIKAIAKVQAKLATNYQMIKSSEARYTTLKANMHYKTVKADQCWSRVEALEKIALKEEVEVLKRERSSLQDELKRKDELIIDVVESRQARIRDQVELMVKLASKEYELKSTEARCAALEANLAEAQKTWCRNLEALEKDNMALKEKVHLLKSAQSQLELVITEIEKRQAQSKQSNQSDSMPEVNLNKELQSTKYEREDTPEKSKGNQELAQIEEECSSEVEHPQAGEDCSGEVEPPKARAQCSGEVEPPQAGEDCSGEVEPPHAKGECSSEVEPLQDGEECSFRPEKSAASPAGSGRT